MDKLERVANLEKGKILKESLKIVDKLAENDLGDIDGDITTSDFDVEELKDLIVRARKLKKNTFWKLT
jgi:hypothetical protein